MWFVARPLSIYIFSFLFFFFFHSFFRLFWPSASDSLWMLMFLLSDLGTDSIHCKLFICFFVFCCVYHWYMHSQLHPCWVYSKMLMHMLCACVKSFLQFTMISQLNKIGNFTVCCVTWEVPALNVKISYSNEFFVIIKIKLK